jgi:hypothetical protein
VLSPGHLANPAEVLELALQAQFSTLTGAVELQLQPKFATPSSPEDAKMVTPTDDSLMASVWNESKVDFDICYNEAVKSK